MITNRPAPDHLDERLCHLQCFSKDQRKKDRSDSEPDTMSSFQKTPASRWRGNTYNAPSFDRIYLKICLTVNPEDWDVDFAFPDFNLKLCLSENETDIETES